MKIPWLTRRKEKPGQTLSARMAMGFGPEDQNDEFESRLANERCKTGAIFIKQLPDFPPNCKHLTITFLYDDGRSIEVQIGVDDAVS